MFFCLCISYFRSIVLRPFRSVHGDRPQCHRNGRTVRIARRTPPGRRCTESAQHDRTASLPRFEMTTTRFVGLWAVCVLSSVATSAPEQQKQERPVRPTFGRDSGEKRDNHRHTAFFTTVLYCAKPENGCSDKKLYCSRSSCWTIRRFRVALQSFHCRNRLAELCRGGGQGVLRPGRKF